MSKNKNKVPSTTQNNLSEKNASKKSTNKTDDEIMFNLPGGLKYKIPGQKQRIILSSLLVGLNLLLVICVILYQYVPSFKEFVFNIGR